MPLAPASSHWTAAQTGSGSSALRACLTVATWSILTFNTAIFSPCVSFDFAQDKYRISYVVMDSKTYVIIELVWCTSRE